ncbi:hypothetical protein LJC21_01825 [Bacteroides sp. OttesenSCG-928-E20]|nr:hypothetical protein [Bacteroides sp. OttesenSCG-928-E20]MDL2304433.1 hypothetical protein [Bacteroides sp. OttesenSCG-928-D19]
METTIDYNNQKPKHQDVSISPMHTAEHILNQTMVRMFGCPRSRNSHIERKKSKCDYLLDTAPSAETLTEIENRVNEIIKQNLPVREEFVTQDNIPPGVDLSKLPEDVSETLRLVTIGDYDICACIGRHVSSTAEIGTFKIISSDFADGKLRIRFKLL